jgi:hypothetical protein
MSGGWLEIRRSVWLGEEPVEGGEPDDHDGSAKPSQPAATRAEGAAEGAAGGVAPPKAASAAAGAPENAVIGALLVEPAEAPAPVANEEGDSTWLGRLFRYVCRHKAPATRGRGRVLFVIAVAVCASVATGALVSRHAGPATEAPPKAKSKGVRLARTLPPHLLAPPWWYSLRCHCEYVPRWWTFGGSKVVGCP